MGNKASTTRRHSSRCCATLCASPQVSLIFFSSTSTVLQQVFFGCPSLHFPGGVQLSFSILRTWPSHLSCRSFISRTMSASCFGVQLLVSYSPIVEGTDFIHVPFNHSPAFRAVHEDRFYTTVVELNLCPKMIQSGLPDWLKSCECPTSFGEPCLDVFICSIVLTNDAPQVCEFLCKIKWYAIYSDRCRCSRVSPGKYEKHQTLVNNY